MKLLLHIGLNVQKDGIVIAIAEDGPKGEMRTDGEVHSLKQKSSSPRSSQADLTRASPSIYKNQAGGREVLHSSG